MVFENDPFEKFKQQRQVEKLERKFIDKAETRKKELDQLLRSGKRTPELANRIQDEMQRFFTESQEHVSHLMNESDHPDSRDLEQQVHNEMADFFRDSTETAQELLTRLCESDTENDASDLADRVVDHLRNVFQQSIDHIAEVREKYGAQTEPAGEPAAGDELTDMVQALNEGLEGSEQLLPPEAPPPEPTPAPPPTRRGLAAASHPPAPMGVPNDVPPLDREGDDSSPGGHRILRRHKHIPTGKPRRRVMSSQELSDFRAIKELLIEKGLITRDELAEMKAKLAQQNLD
jgi:hypothetical protein